MPGYDKPRSKRKLPAFIPLTGLHSKKPPSDLEGLRAIAGYRVTLLKFGNGLSASGSDERLTISATFIMFSQTGRIFGDVCALSLASSDNHSNISISVSISDCFHRSKTGVLVCLRNFVKTQKGPGMKELS
ncbi:hypothetical protein [Paenibacillus sp. yr247]|uniref:hypothetical protein n=1 Tax=Paenibacillus sp. yr247 TaxID=1761880 RepID=UPI000B888C7F|nr:hypothetical protein [Paenibacillus sp. yr247]